MNEHLKYVTDCPTNWFNRPPLYDRAQRVGFCGNRVQESGGAGPKLGLSVAGDRVNRC